MTNILFVSLGLIALGEIVIALDFARRLPRQKFRSHFIIAPIHRLLFKDGVEFGATELHEGHHQLNKILFDDALVRNRADVIILADYLTFAYSIPEFGITLDFLRQFQLPILSFDCYEWDSTDYLLDFLDGREKHIPLRFAELSGVLRPCPLNHPQRTGEKIAVYSFLEKCAAPTKANSARIKQELKIPREATTVFSPVAPWQRIQREKNATPKFISVVEDLIRDYIAGLGNNVHWILVGDGVEPGTRREGPVHVHGFRALPPSEFDWLVASTDLLLTTNVAGTTLAKCISYGGTAVLLWNSVTAQCEDDLSRYSDVTVDAEVRSRLVGSYPLHSFRMFPMGWSGFLNAVLRDNPFLHTFHKAEILDSRMVSFTLSNVISGQNDEIMVRRERYLADLAALPTPEQCLMRLIS